MMTDDIAPFSVIDALRHHARVIGAVMAATIIVCAIAIFAIEPIYTSTSLLQIDPRARNSVSSTDTSSIADNAHVDAQVLLATSPEVLSRVIAQLSLLDGPDVDVSMRLLDSLGLGSPSGDKSARAQRQAVTRLASLVTVQRRGQTYVLAITARSSDPDAAQQLATAVARAYLDQQGDLRDQSLRASQAALSSQLEAAFAAISQSDGNLDTYLEHHVDQIDDPRLAGLGQQLAQLGWLRDNANERIASLDPATASPSEISTLQAQIGDAERAALPLRQTLRTVALESPLPAYMLTELYALHQSTELALAHYNELLVRNRELQAQAGLHVPAGTIVSAAQRPDAPAWPNRRLLLSLSAVLGLGLGMVAALINAQRQPAPTASQAVLSMPKMPWRQGDTLPDQVITQPGASYSQSLRQIRRQVDQTLPDTDQGTLVMIGADHPEDARRTAMALGRLYAQTDLHALLVTASGRQKQLGSTSDMADRIEVDALTPLSILPHGDDVVLPESLLNAARKTFDVIIVDTPMLADIAHLADAAVYLGRYSGKRTARRLATIEANMRHGSVLLPVLVETAPTQILRLPRLLPVGA